MRTYISFYEEWIKADLPRIVSIQTNLTNVCPQHCIMCNKPEWARIQTGRNAQLDPVHTADQLNSMPYLETVILSGGDPMNYPRLLEFMDGVDYHIKFGMFTTGLDNAKNRYFDLDSERFGYIRFSIDGNTPETWAKIRGSVPQSYETAWKNVLQQKEIFKEIFGHDANEHIRVQYTIQSANIHEFAQMVEKCHHVDIPIYGYWVHDYNLVSKEQVNELKFILRLMLGRNTNGWLEKWTNIKDICQSGDSVPQELDAKKCVIPLTHAFIDTDGSVFTCCYLVGDNLPFAQRDMKYSYGNIYETPLEEILSKENIDKTRRAFINNDNPICNACCSNQSRYYKVNAEAQALLNRRPTFL